MGIKIFKISVVTALLFILVACASSFLKYDKADDLKKNDEFSNRVKIVTAEEPVAETPTTDEDEARKEEENRKALLAAKTVTPTTLPPTKVLTKKKTATVKASAPSISSSKREPDIEDSVGFSGRRPLKDPFGVGEKVVHDVSYMGVSAGTLVLESRPYAQVNNRKNYQFRISISTTPFFSSFYSVKDYVDVLMDFETLVPSVFTLHVKESGQLREAQMFFDHEKNQANYWEKKVTKKNGEENKKQQWEILPYTQSLFSAVFYLRFFQWEVGKENAFRVTNDEKNLVFRGKCVRKERIKTDAGEFDAIVIKPEVELSGKFETIGDNYIWLSDDDRRYILRIESKIKIGTLVSEVEKIEPGR